MSLTISLSLAIASTRTTATITDATVYGEDSNPARSAVACYLTAYKVDKDNNETALTVSSDDSDPQTDSVWTITLGVDGHHKFPFIIVPDYDAGETYEQYDAVYDSGTDAVYRSLVGSNTGQSVSDTAYWEEISDPSSLANNKDTDEESGNVTSLVYLRVPSPNSQYEFANRLSSQSPHQEGEDESHLRDYLIFSKMLDEVAVADSRSEVLDGEIICRRIYSKFID